MMVWHWLTGAAPPAPPPPRRGHMPELHAFKQQQTALRLQTDLLRRELEAEEAADRAIWKNDADVPG